MIDRGIFLSSGFRARKDKSCGRDCNRLQSCPEAPRIGERAVVGVSTAICFQRPTERLRE